MLIRMLSRVCMWKETRQISSGNNNEINYTVSNKGTESNTSFTRGRAQLFTKMRDAFVQRLTNRVLYSRANYSRSMHNL